MTDKKPSDRIDEILDEQGGVIKYWSVGWIGAIVRYLDEVAERGDHPVVRGCPHDAFGRAAPQLRALREAYAQHGREVSDGTKRRNLAYAVRDFLWALDGADR